MIVDFFVQVNRKRKEVKMEGGGHGEDKRIMMGLFFGSLGLLAVLSLRSLCNRKDECESNCAICTPVF